MSELSGAVEMGFLEGYETPQLYRRITHIQRRRAASASRRAAKRWRREHRRKR